MKKHTWFVLFFLIVIVITGCEYQLIRLPENSYDYTITNPYEDIDWNTIDYYDANFHTHTRLSDGDMDPHDVVDAYHAIGYRILALTDHNTSHYPAYASTLYPWTSFSTIDGDESWQDRDPSVLGMVSVEGSEISQHHHIGSWFNDFVGTSQTEEETLSEISNRNGLAIFHHPGRYENSDSWYVDMFARYPVLIGLEIFNQKDRYNDDRDRWDRILHQSMPERPVWGFGNDDMHSPSTIGWNRNILVLSQFSETAVRDALVDGEFFVFKPFIRTTLPDIRIVGIEILDDGIQLEVEGQYNSIKWITYYSETNDSEVISLGDTFSTTSLPLDAAFVRAIVFSDDGMLFTQPFGLQRIN